MHWHTSHSAIYLAISRFILVHQNLCFRSSYILVLLGWIENLERWASSKICFLNSRFLGTTSLFLNHMTPSWSCLKHKSSPSLSFRLMWAIPWSLCWAAMICSLRVGTSSRFDTVPCGSIPMFNLSISAQSVVTGFSIRWQLQWLLRLNASATTLAFPG